jgi:hypothetical protein
MRYLFILLLLLPLSSFGQEPESLLDVEVGFGSYQLQLKYIFEGTKAPYEGYLLQAPDIAILKLDLDSYKEDCQSIVEDASIQCLNDLQDCALSCDSRLQILVDDNYKINAQLEKKIDELKIQKQNTILYSIAAASVAWAATSLYFILK